MNWLKNIKLRYEKKINSFLKFNNITTDFIFKSILIAVLFLILRFPINKYIIDGKLEILVNYIEQGDKIDNILFGLILVLLLVTTVTKALKEYVVSAKKLWILTLVVLIYSALYRYKENPYWHLESIQLTHQIKFFDIIYFYWFLHLCLFIRIQIYRNPKPYTAINSFYEDSSKSFGEIDLFNRKVVSESLHNYILGTNNEKAFAIGVVGNWGTGKSVFLNFLENNLDTERWIVVKFNPWRNENHSAIIKDFFNQLKEELTKYNEDISEEVSNYLNELTKIENAYLKQALEFSSKLLSDTPSLSTLYHSLDQSIRKLDKKLIIFIDDIDRLDTNEVFEVLKIVRNTGGFGNTFFILAYDKDYVNNFISDRNSANSVLFLEKIIQFEILLPPIDPYVVKNELLEKLRPKLNRIDADKLSNLLFNPDLTGESLIDLEKYIQNLRDVIRFVNNFSFSYSNFSSIEEIVFEEFFIIELIKFKAPKDYQFLFDNFKYLTQKKLVDNEIIVLQNGN